MEGRSLLEAFCQNLEILWMSESGREQKGGVCMVRRYKGLGRIWKTLSKPRVAVCLDSDVFLSSARIVFSASTSLQ